MDKVTIRHIEQQLRLNRSVKALNTDKSLFYLYLSMLEKDLSHTPRFVDAQSTNEIVYADIESHHYRHPALQFTKQDFTLQSSFAAAVNSQASSSLQLLNAFFPQGLSEHNDHLRLGEDVVTGLDFYAKQRVNKIRSADDNTQFEKNTIQIDETALFDLIPQASEFAF